MGIFNCKDCGRKNSPYLTAYESALRHGFVGTEEEWVKSIGAYKVIQVTERTDGTFACNVNLSTARGYIEDGFIPVLIYEGIPAILSDVSDDYLAFSTQVLRGADGDYYDMYILAREKTVESVKINGSGSGGTIGPGTVTYTMLHANVRAALNKADSAYQKREPGIPYDDLTPQVQEYLDLARTAIQSHQSLAGLVPRNRQAAKTVNHTQEVAIDPTGKLYIEPVAAVEAEIEEHTELLTMTYYDGDTYCSMTSAEIYALLEDGNKAVVLIDRAGRQCNLITPPAEESSEYTDAKFWTFDESGENIIVHSVNDSGIVSSESVAITGYQKPLTGIPSTDMSAEVQASLEKADSAIQSHQSLAGLVPRDRQAAKTIDHTQEVAIDANGKLWVEPTTSPESGGRQTALYGFLSLTAYQTFITDHPTAISDYDIVIIRSGTAAGATSTVYYAYSTQPASSSNPAGLVKVYSLDEYYVVTVSNSNGYSTDKTFAQITAAYEDGKKPVLMTEFGALLPCTKADNNSITFSGALDSGTSGFWMATYTITSSGVTARAQMIDFVPILLSVSNGVYDVSQTPGFISGVSDIIGALQAGANICMVVPKNANSSYIHRPLEITSTMEIKFGGNEDGQLVVYTLSSSDAHVLRAVAGVPPAASGTIANPSTDKGKVPRVGDTGAYELDAIREVPASSAADAGKELRVGAAGGAGWGVRTRRIRLGTFNVGQYRNGVATNTVPGTMVEDMRSFVNAQNLDVLCLTEHRDFTDGTDDSRPAMYSGFYPYHCMTSEVISAQGNPEKTRFLILSRYPILSYETITWTDGRRALAAVIDVDGVTINVVDIHLASYLTGEHDELRSVEYADIIDYMEAHPRCVVCGDCNAGVHETYTTTVAQAEYDLLLNAGMRCASGGYVGLLVTADNEANHVIRHMDNIFTTPDIQLAEIQAPDVRAELNSDHKPVIAELRIGVMPE